MKCPNCGYEQYCPCPSCKDRLPKDKLPWKWIDGELVSCGNCGFTMHCDGWVREEWRQYKDEYEEKQCLRPRRK